VIEINSQIILMRTTLSNIFRVFINLVKNSFPYRTSNTLKCQYLLRHLSTYFLFFVLFLSLRSEFRVVMSLRLPHKTMFGSFFTSSCL
jgi:hypothetical protein